MRFSYTASNRSGETVSGMAEAMDRQTVIANLQKQGLRPVVVKLEGAGNKGPRSGKVKTKEVVAFTRQLSTMVSAGVPLVRSLSTLQGQTSSKGFANVLGSVAKDAESGLSLSEAFAKFPNVFSDVYINMVRAGEAGGILDDILKRLATQLEKDASMKKKIKSAMMNPMVISGITVIAFFGIMFFVIPKIGKILKDLGGPDAKLPIYTQILLDLSAFIKHYAPIISYICGREPR